MRILSLALLASLMACGTSSPVSNIRSEASGSKLIGRYALEANLTSRTTPIKALPSFNMESTGRLYKIVDIEASDQGLILRERACDLTFSGDYMQLQLNKGAYRRTAEIVTPLSLNGEGFSRGESVQLFGVELADPMNDPLPQSVQAKSVIDADGDGKPGVTAMATLDGSNIPELRGLASIPLIGGLFKVIYKAELHFAQRSVNSYLKVQPTQDGSLKGQLVDRTTQQILEALPVPGATRFPLDLKGPQEADLVLEKSTVHFVRVSADATCDSTDFKKLYRR